MSTVVPIFVMSVAIHDCLARGKSSTSGVHLGHQGDYCTILDYSPQAQAIIS